MQSWKCKIQSKSLNANSTCKNFKSEKNRGFPTQKSGQMQKEQLSHSKWKNMQKKMQLCKYENAKINMQIWKAKIQTKSFNANSACQNFKSEKIVD